MKVHLGEYKLHHLGVRECGLWRYRPYRHILPQNLFRLNIIETYRAQFWEYFEAEGKRREMLRERFDLHEGFHHLNSSQAMCFNLFFPFVIDESSRAGSLFEALNESLPEHLRISNDPPAEQTFEKILDKEEGTNFDFYVRLKSGRKILFELKLSEKSFGDAEDDKNHREKFERVYKPRLDGRIDDEYKNRERFFANYQVLRNILWLNSSKQDLLFFVYPQQNEVLSPHRGTIDHAPERGLKELVKCIHLEDLAERISRQQDEQDPRFCLHYRMFKEKYLLT